MITKFLSKLKSILFKSKVSATTTVAKKTVAKKPKKITKSTKASKSKSKKEDPKKLLKV